MFDQFISGASEEYCLIVKNWRLKNLGAILGFRHGVTVFAKGSGRLRLFSLFFSLSFFSKNSEILRPLVLCSCSLRVAKHLGEPVVLKRGFGRPFREREAGIFDPALVFVARLRSPALGKLHSCSWGKLHSCSWGSLHTYENFGVNYTLSRPVGHCSLSRKGLQKHRFSATGPPKCLATRREQEQRTRGRRISLFLEKKDRKKKGKIV